MTEPTAVIGRIGLSDVMVRELDRAADLAVIASRYPERYPFLLQSTAAAPPLGRYDILFACTGESLHRGPDGRLAGRTAAGGTRFLEAMDNWWHDEAVASVDSPLPFHGGWFVYLGYELAAEIEPTLRLAPDAVLPAAFAVRCRAALIRDHQEDRTWAVAEPDAADALDRVAADAVDRSAHETAERQAPLRVVDEEPGERFMDAVRRAKEYIAAGDIYQANLSRAWSADVADGQSPDRVYAALRRSNPAPFAGLVRWRGSTIISSSPERLVKVRDRVVSTRPIAGTRPRSDDADVDDSLSAELFAHPKERAEHVMLIDLERNDLGRVCQAGSVEVDEFMVLESYAHVHHIVSNVRGHLRDRATPGAVLRAVFPGGTITGCPKVRCMQIIDELEHEPRGAYTGSFGYVNRDGSMDFNILIRTMVMQAGRVTFRAGSGIVADSEPEAELAETRAKAKGLLRALSA